MAKPGSPSIPLAAISPSPDIFTSLRKQKAESLRTLPLPVRYPNRPIFSEGDLTQGSFQPREQKRENGFFSGSLFRFFISNRPPESFQLRPQEIAFAQRKKKINPKPRIKCRFLNAIAPPTIFF